MKAVAERLRGGSMRWHLPDGPLDEDASWQPVLCGGGIVFPGPRVETPKEHICRACWVRSCERESSHPV